MEQTFLRPQSAPTSPAGDWANTLLPDGVETFYWKLAAVQICILFMPFAGVLSTAELLILGLTFALLLVREAYVAPGERLDCEFITTLMTPAVILVLHIALSWAFPYGLLSSEALAPRLVALSVPIGFFRYHYKPNVTPESPYKDLLRLHYRVWFFNDLWIAGAFTYLLTLSLAVAPKWRFEGYFTVYPAVLLFSTATRFQLNPLGGTHRHRRIFNTLFTDPHQDEIRMKRDYLLTGTDWLNNIFIERLWRTVTYENVFLHLRGCSRLQCGTI